MIREVPFPLASSSSDTILFCLYACTSSTELVKDISNIKRCWFFVVVVNEVANASCWSFSVEIRLNHLVAGLVVEGDECKKSFFFSFVGRPPQKNSRNQVRIKPGLLSRYFSKEISWKNVERLSVKMDKFIFFFCNATFLPSSFPLEVRNEERSGL